MSLRTRIKTWLYTLSGDDSYIIRQCDRGRQNRFAAIGFFVACILVMCFVASYISFWQLFNSHIIAFFTGVAFSFTIINIYLLMIYTLTRNTLPHEKTSSGKVFSIVLRCAFVCFIAFIVAKPLERQIYGGVISDEIALHRDNEIRNAILSDDSLLRKELFRLSQLPVDKNTSSLMKERIASHKRAKIAMTLSAIKSNYYIESLAILHHKHPSSYCFTILIIGVFLSPIILKSLVSPESDYYQLKQIKDRIKVQAEYMEFRENYYFALSACGITDRPYIENYEDPPFNTILKKEELDYSEQDSLIKELYG